MMKKTLLTVIAIAAIALCACQTQGNKIGANATDIGGKTWTEMTKTPYKQSSSRTQTRRLISGNLLFLNTYQKRSN